VKGKEIRHRMAEAPGEVGQLMPIFVYPQWMVRDMPHLAL
jgi:hypothetical protein